MSRLTKSTNCLMDTPAHLLTASNRGMVMAIGALVHAIRRIERAFKT